eukprot:CAMPEP_0204821202 /NCGR_PEP_ID=MMETSP1018-20131115/4650_1 /ASSEMBLY_ACC=CAM_ASM_000518 /TAXON_ID=46462 /ORGANISM="Anophryoides haemophila, Strain AH6" /LENGTH=30 /DNA_ID= /DNA_START= /DNA_END= /DNA_ORIENTATION=
MNSQKKTSLGDPTKLSYLVENEDEVMNEVK